MAVILQLTELLGVRHTCMDPPHNDQINKQKHDICITKKVDEDKKCEASLSHSLLS